MAAPLLVGAGLMGAGALGSALLQSKASGDAEDRLREANLLAQQQQQVALLQQMGLLQPQYQLGLSGLSGLAGMAGIPQQPRSVFEMSAQSGGLLDRILERTGDSRKDIENMSFADQVEWLKTAADEQSWIDGNDRNVLQGLINQGRNEVTSMGPTASMTRAEIQAMPAQSQAPVFQTADMPPIPATPSRPGLPSTGDVPAYLGNKVLPSLRSDVGPVPEYQRMTYDALMNDPGYQFELAQGNRAIESSASAGGTLHSGRTLKELSQYQQGLAATRFNEAWQRNLADWGAEYQVNLEENRRRLEDFGVGMDLSREAEARNQFQYAADVGREQTQYSRALGDYQLRDAAASQSYADLLRNWQLETGQMYDIYNLQNQAFQDQWGRLAGLAGYSAAAAPQMASSSMQAAQAASSGLQSAAENAANLGLYQAGMWGNTLQNLANLGARAYGEYGSSPPTYYP